MSNNEWTGKRDSLVEVFPLKGHTCCEKSVMLVFFFFSVFFFNEVRPFVFFLFITQAGENESV